MILYYTDEQGNYFTDQNGNLYSISKPLIKKYRPIVYKDGKFQKVKSYIKLENYFKSVFPYISYAGDIENLLIDN